MTFQPMLAAMGTGIATGSGACSGVCSHKRHLSSRTDRDVLPANVNPLHYDLTITPNMESFTFEGRVIIT